jgi:uncharacterized protein
MIFHNINLPELLLEIDNNYALDIGGPHGWRHWGRVVEIGLTLNRWGGAPVELPLLFGLLHDSCRDNDENDPEHGYRAAMYAADLNGEFFRLNARLLDVLCSACAGHTQFRYHPDPWVQMCWDSDRLDLARTGKVPEVVYLGTQEAKRSSLMAWAAQRSLRRARPHVLDPHLPPHWQ